VFNTAANRTGTVKFLVTISAMEAIVAVIAIAMMKICVAIFAITVIIKAIFADEYGISVYIADGSHVVKHITFTMFAL
jgi:hypothetical protein